MASQHVEESDFEGSSSTLTAPAHHTAHRAGLASLVAGAARRGFWRHWHKPALYIEGVFACRGGQGRRDGRPVRNPVADVLVADHGRHRQVSDIRDAS